MEKTFEVMLDLDLDWTVPNIDLVCTATHIHRQSDTQIARQPDRNLGLQTDRHIHTHRRI